MFFISLVVILVILLIGEVEDHHLRVHHRSFVSVRMGRVLIWILRIAMVTFGLSIILFFF